MASRTCKLPVKTADRLLACAAVGLTYHAAHPVNNHVWALDDNGRAHVVRIDMRERTAVHVCDGARPEGVWSSFHRSTRWSMAARTNCDGDQIIRSFPDVSAIAAHYGSSLLDATLAVMPGSKGWETDMALFELPKTATG